MDCQIKKQHFSPTEWQQIVRSNGTHTSHTDEAFRELEINTLAKETLSFKKRLEVREMENDYGPGGSW